MKLPYQTTRKAYFLGILALIVYALPGVTFIKEKVYPVLTWTPFANLPLISLIAILVGLGAGMAYFDRKLG